ncbi:hypothetical protein SO802_022550 [Lithocarpus litseifolius]|uniref:Uncharacterized protein n=1 Tax=Lithocarpus litseifolius TaxID=425828 RepID=A0AAW2C437_9ROSI
MVNSQSFMIMLICIKPHYKIHVCDFSQSDVDMEERNKYTTNMLGKPKIYHNFPCNRCVPFQRGKTKCEEEIFDPVLKLDSRVFLLLLLIIFIAFGGGFGGFTCEMELQQSLPAELWQGQNGFVGRRYTTIYGGMALQLKLELTMCGRISVNLAMFWTCIFLRVQQYVDFSQPIGFVYHLKESSSRCLQALDRITHQFWRQLYPKQDVEFRMMVDALEVE